MRELCSERQCAPCDASHIDMSRLLGGVKEASTKCKEITF